MKALTKFIRLAWKNLFRGGQRILVAFLCIVFGVMALVAMTMMAKSIESAIVFKTPSQLLGGDLSIGRKAENYLLPEHIDQLNALSKSGEISRYTLISFTQSIMFHASGSSEMNFAGTGLGIETDNYPLAGSLTIGLPRDVSLGTLLWQAGDTVITRDIAEENNLKVGDPIVLADPRLGIPVQGTVRGIAYDTPNHQGNKIYYSLTTAQKLAGGQPVINTVIVNTPHIDQAITDLESKGWSVDWAAGRDIDQTGNAWTLGLRGAGILGLLVGGVGIANTMQVLLRRRQREIAVWKTLGYRTGDLRLIFSLEAGLLGLGGSLVGAVLGVLISTGLLELLRRTSSLLYQWTFSWTPPLIGILVGTLTTVIFAAWGIAISSQARPVALLRNEPVDVRQATGCQSAGLAVLLGLPFTALASLVMGNILSGIGVLLGILVLIGILGGFFSGILWLAVRIVPQRVFPMARLAFNSLRRRKVALVFAMIALFAGVITMSLGLAVVQLSQLKINSGALEVQGYNLNVLASADQQDAIQKAIHAQSPEIVDVGYRTQLASLSLAGSSEPVAKMDPVLVGRSEPSDYVVSGPGWGSQPDGVYAYKWSNLKAGSQVQATFKDGTRHVFTVVGTYDIRYDGSTLFPPIGLLLPADGFSRVAQPDNVAYFVQVTPERLSQAASALGKGLPQASVLNMDAYAGRFMRSYQNLYILAISLAGLALLAGFLLVANSVSLAMLDRRYEIGILKATGYSRRQVLSIFAVEYGLAGLLATLTGVLAVQGLLGVIAIGSRLAISLLLLNLPSLAVVALCGIGLTLLVVLGVTWNPTRVSPVTVLSEQN